MWRVTEYRMITFAQPAGKVFPALGTVSSLTVDFTDSIPELAEHMDGWEVINSQVVPAGEVVYLTFFLRTEVRVDSLPVVEGDSA